MQVASERYYRQQFYDILVNSFNEEELKTFCFILNVGWDNLSGFSVTEKARELILYMERQGRLQDLAEAIQKERPNIDLPFLTNSNEINPSQSMPQGEADEIGHQSYISPNIPEPSFEESRSFDESIPSQNTFQPLYDYPNVYLTQHQGVRLLGVVTEQPWNLPVDAFVLPLSDGTSFLGGGLGNALLHATHLSEKATDIKAAFAASVLSDGEGSFKPDRPFVIQEPDGRAWQIPDTNRKVIAATISEKSVANLDNISIVIPAIIQLAVNNNIRTLAIPTIGAGGGNLPIDKVVQTIIREIIEALPEATKNGPVMDEIMITTIDSAAALTMQQMFLRRPRAAANDNPVGRDLLNVETAIYALAEMCMLKDLEPPLAIGILGGWGSGKSFVMHLMQERIAQLRRLRITNDYPYIGHVYQITFDAWTYAKSNLWASLMQTVFYELNRQLTRENEIAKILADVQSIDREADRQKVFKVLKEDSSLWQLTAYPNLRARNAHELILYAAELDKAFKETSPGELRKEAERWLNGHEWDDGVAMTEIKHDHLWVELRKLKKEERDQLRQKEKELAEAQQKLEKAKLELNAQITKEIEQESKDLAWKPIRNLIRQQFRLAYRYIEQQFTGEESEKSLFQTIWDTSKSLAFMILNNPIEFALFLLFAVLLVFLDQSFLPIKWQLPSWLLPLATIIGGCARSYNKWINLIQASFNTYQKQIEDERTRLQDTCQERYNKSLAAQKEAYTNKLQSSQMQPGELVDANLIPAIEDRVTKLRAEAIYFRHRVGMTAGFVSLLDFVNSRLDDAVYEKELGLMHQVQRDLQELSDSLTADTTIENLFPRGRPRIILYIDDLDRCPPHRVVEVLEAVQLLLKTDLFIVVLAIDARFVTRALEASYSGILTRKGSPSGLDYIEKIIQIPYMVQPIAEDAVESFLQAQMPASAVSTISRTDEQQADVETSLKMNTIEKATAVSRETIGKVNDTNVANIPASEYPNLNEESVHPAPLTEPDLPQAAIEISDAEFQSLKTRCEQIPMTPRAVKRITNVYKLIKIIWYRQQFAPMDRQKIDLIMTLLTLSEQYPNQMRELFQEITVDLKKAPDKPILDLFHAQMPKEKISTYETRQWVQLLLNAKALIPTSTSLKDIDMRTFMLVRAFCFVGDIGYEANDPALIDSEQSTSD